jgi:hypothetical protein
MRRLPGWSGGIVVALTVVVSACGPVNRAEEDQEGTDGVTAIVPHASVDQFSPNFLEQASCAMLMNGQKVSVNPFSIPPGRTWNIGSRDTIRATQGERRIMVQMMGFQCLPDAILAVEQIVERHRTGLSASAASTCDAHLRTAKKLWLSFALTKYVKGVQAVLFTTVEPRTYEISDSSYPWTYPANGRARLHDILNVLKANGIMATDELSPDLAAYITGALSMEGQPGAPRDFVGNSSTFFDAPLTNRPDDMAALELVEQLHGEIGVGLVCAFEHGEAACNTALPAARTACVLDRGLEAGCPDIRALKVQERQASIDAARTHGLQFIAPFSQGVHHRMTFQDVCVSVQRAHHAHMAWSTAIMENGHTRAGFRDAWMAMFAHSLIHINRTLGEDVPELIPADRGNPLNPTLNPPQSDQRMPLEIRQFVYASVPGVVNGHCEVGRSTDHP